MFGINKCGLFFIAITAVSCCGLVFAQEPSLDLEPILISKARLHLLNPYTIEGGDFFGSSVEVLSSLPIDLQSRSLKGGIQTDFSLRGSTYQGVLVLINGQRINDPQTAHHNSDIPFTSEDIERIEVIPGIGSSLFGPDAVGGAINIILKEPSEKKIILESSFGSHQTKSGTFSITEKKDNLGMRFSLERQESGGFYYDMDFKKFIASLNVVLDIPGGEYNLGLGYLENEFGAYDFYTPASGYASKEWTKTWLLNTGFNVEKQGFLIKPNILWRRHFDKFMLDKTQIRSSYLNHHRTDMFTPNLYLQRHVDGLGKVGLGLEYAEESINSTNLGKHRRSHNSIFFDNSRRLAEGLNLGLSFRFDDYDSLDEVYTGALNLRYNFYEKNSLCFGISKSIRVPSFTEIYYNDPVTLGNEYLSLEESINYQIGYDYKKQDFSCGITFFFRQEEDMIDWVKRSLSQEKWQAENITEAEVLGLETYLKVKINQNLSWDSNYAYVDKRINEQGYLYKYGSNYIRHLFNTYLFFSFPFGKQSIGLSYKKKPVRDGWLLLNTNFSFHFNKYSQVFVRGTNLLNVEYQEIDGIPSPGRWINAGLRFEW